MSVQTPSIISSVLFVLIIIVYDTEPVHYATVIDIFGLCIHGHQFGSPQKNYSGANDAISIDRVLCF